MASGQQRGGIIPIGGAEEKEHSPQILRRLVQLAGGDHADIVVMPTASQVRDTGARYERIFGEMGAGSVSALAFETAAFIAPDNTVHVEGAGAITVVDAAGAPVAAVGAQAAALLYAA